MRNDSEGEATAMCLSRSAIADRRGYHREALAMTPADENKFMLFVLSLALFIVLMALAGREILGGLGL